MLPEIDQIDKELEELKNRRNNLIKNIQKICSHPIEAVRECKYIEHSSPPLRVCTLCGLLAQGWNHLQDNYPKMHPYKEVKYIERESLVKYIRRTD